jgi:hypothetical protein
MPDPTPQRLFIVSREDPVTYNSLTKVLADDPSVQVLYDRRMSASDRRGIWATSRLQTVLLGERRQRPEIDAQIRSMGWACVRVGADAKAPPHPERRPRT